MIQPFQKMKRILLSLILIRLFAPSVELTKEAMDRLEEIPQYSKFLRRAGYPEKNYTIERISAPSPPILTLPAIELCKEGPQDNSFYSHVFCWSMIGLYIMLFVSLVIYQLRSVFWLKTNIPKNNVQQSNSNDIELQPLHNSNLSRMFSM